MKNRLKNLVKNNPIDWILLRKLVLFFLVVAVITFIVNIVVRYNSVGYLQRVYSGFEPKSEFDEFLYIFRNNALTVPLVVLIVALIPIPYLWMYAIVMNGIIFGTAFAIPFTNAKVTLFEMFTELICHSIIELFAFFILFTVAFKLNKAVCQKLYKHGKNSVKKAIGNYLKLYFIYVLPLLFIAALLETYVSERFADIFR
ncbi:stage II sporulation protein M [Fructilactobacillus sp. Tb1]|uniref:stage II sporulation protein M n=1 Tax=Fructilactobacillus sp. Tb1 TaxID=3422304 RepID=UPI003D27C7DC